MIDRKDVVVFDFETTGLDSKADNILEIGAIKYKLEDGLYQIVDELQLILKTDVLINEKITEITGITKEIQMLEGVSQEEGFHRLSALIDDNSLLIAYNIQFDLGFLTEFYRKFYKSNYNITNDILDVMAVYKDRHAFPWRLEQALKTYHVNLPNTHRALDDVKATFGVLEAMAAEKNNINKYINVIGFNPKYGLSGPRLSHVSYVGQYGGKGEINKL